MPNSWRNRVGMRSRVTMLKGNQATPGTNGTLGVIRVAAMSRLSSVGDSAATRRAKYSRKLP